MKQRLAIILMAALLATPVIAQDIQAQITSQLHAQGFDTVDVSRTWLGRLRFEGRGETQTREIIVNPRTGEILRDFLTTQESGESPSIQILDRSAPNVREGEAAGARDVERGQSSAGGSSGGDGEGPGAPAR